MQGSLVEVVQIEAIDDDPTVPNFDKDRKINGAAQAALQTRFERQKFTGLPVSYIPWPSFDAKPCFLPEDISKIAMLVKKAMSNPDTVSASDRETSLKFPPRLLRLLENLGLPQPTLSIQHLIEFLDDRHVQLEPHLFVATHCTNRECCVAPIQAHQLVPDTLEDWLQILRPEHTSVGGYRTPMSQISSPSPKDAAVVPSIHFEAILQEAALAPLDSDALDALAKFYGYGPELSQRSYLKFRAFAKMQTMKKIVQISEKQAAEQAQACRCLRHAKVANKRVVTTITEKLMSLPNDLPISGGNISKDALLRLLKYVEGDPTIYQREDLVIWTSNHLKHHHETAGRCIFYQ